MRQQEEEQHQTFTFSKDLEGVFAIHMRIYKHKPYTLLIPYSLFSISLLQLPEIPTPMPSREEMPRWFTQTHSFTYSYLWLLCKSLNKNPCPHQAYVELNELRGEVWQEMGRWLGYEENLSPITGQWSQPHISYLTFKSLIQLRKVMSTGETPRPVSSGLDSLTKQGVERTGNV